MAGKSTSCLDDELDAMFPMKDLPHEKAVSPSCREDHNIYLCTSASRPSPRSSPAPTLLLVSFKAVLFSKPHLYPQPTPYPGPAKTKQSPKEDATLEPCLHPAMQCNAPSSSCSGVINWLARVAARSVLIDNGEAQNSDQENLSNSILCDLTSYDRHTCTILTSQYLYENARSKIGK